ADQIKNGNRNHGLLPLSICNRLAPATGTTCHHLKVNGARSETNPPSRCPTLPPLRRHTALTSLRNSYSMNPQDKQAIESVFTRLGAVADSAGPRDPQAESYI